MYLEIFLADFAVFRVFGGISRDFAEIPEFRGSATARNIRSPVLRRLELTYGGTSKEQSPLYNKLYFFAPVIVKCMEKNLDIMKPQ